MLCFLPHPPLLSQPQIDSCSSLVLPCLCLTLGCGGWFSLQLDSDDLLDAPVEAQSAFYEGPGVSGWPLAIAYTAGAEGGAEAGGQAWACPG